MDFKKREKAEQAGDDKDGAPSQQPVSPAEKPKNKKESDSRHLKATKPLRDNQKKKRAAGNNTSSAQRAFADNQWIGDIKHPILNYIRIYIVN